MNVDDVWRSSLTWIAGRAHLLAAFFIPFAAYWHSASADPSSWDTAEMQSVPYLLGIAHPTGFPLYTMAGWLFSHVLPISSVAFRLNLFGGACTAAAVAAAFLIACEFRVPKTIALVGALWFAFTHDVWVHASKADVHDLALALSAFCVYAAIRWLHNGDRRSLNGCAVLFGLALATHPIAIWLAPGLIVVLVLRRSSLERADLYRIAGVVAAGLALYLYLPIRSETVALLGQDPTAHLQGVRGGLFWNYNDPRTVDGFFAEVLGSQFGAGGSLQAALDPRRFQDDLWNWLTLVNASFGSLALALSVFGFGRLWRSDRAGAAALVVLCLAAVPFSFAYSAEGDSDRYRMLSLLLIAVLVAATCVDVRTASDRLRAVCVGLLATVLAYGTYESNLGTYGYGGPTGQRLLIARIAALVPKDSVVLIGWVDSTTLAYGAYVDGSFAGRIVIPDNEPAYAPFYPQWARLHAVYNVEPESTAVKQSEFAALCRIDDVHILYRYGPYRAPAIPISPAAAKALKDCRAS